MRGLLPLVATALMTTMLFVAPATATPPDDVSMTIVETFNPTVGTFTASGGVFRARTTGTSTGEWFKFDSFSFTSRDHFIVFEAGNRVTTPDGSFAIVFEASCRFITFDPGTGDATAVCSGSWQVNGGTGAYTRLQGTGSWNEPEVTNVYANTGGGTNTLTGRMHVG